MSRLQKAKKQSIDDYGGCTVSGKGLRLGVKGKPITFFVHTATVDLFYLDIKIQAPTPSSKETKEIPVEYRCIEPHLHGVKFYPKEAGIYVVSVKWNGINVYGSPFQVQIHSKEGSAEEEQLYSSK